MTRRIALLLSIASLGAAAAQAASAKPVDDACNQVSPTAAACIGIDKPAEAAAAECRAAGVPDGACVMPVGHDVLASDLAAYQSSWLHRAAQRQFALGGSVPLRAAQWLGTHNSFNTDANGLTLSHTDNNQQLTLTEQLDGDVRALELDVHYVPGTETGGTDVVRVCHGRGPDQYHAGCTTEPLLTAVLPEITRWIDAHPDQVVLLYLEDELGAAAGYDQTVSALDHALVRSDGSSMIYRPDPAQIGAGGCANLPLDVSRDDVRAAGANLVLVGNCRSGWSSDVYSWDANHVESGSTPGYQPFPACDQTYGPSVYASKLVRYFEDSTWVSAAVDPTQSPAGHGAGMLSPAKVTSMIDCGVNLLGFDQFEPGDGRVEASIWSWAPNQPDATAGACAEQRSDGRWISDSCATRRPAACRTPQGTWILTPAIPAAAARAACAARGATFAAPRTGPENEALRVTAAGADPRLGGAT
jgi:hypothetical protein